MWIKGFIVGGLLLVLTIAALSFGFIWLNVAIFNELGYQKSLAVDGAQIAAVLVGSCWHARRVRKQDAA
jgi:hypothetical protein